MQGTHKDMDVDMLDGIEDWPLDARAQAALEKWELLDRTRSKARRQSREEQR